MQAMLRLSSWHLVSDAAAGDADARAAFADRFLPIARAYLGARWRSGPFLAELDDAVQEVFVDCFKEQGALDRADRQRGRSFRAFFFAVVRNVALRVEERQARTLDRTADDALRESQHVADDPTLSRVFDGEWARAIMQETAALQRARAEEAGDRQRRRVELLRLRFDEGLPIRDIARLWDADAAMLHHEYAEARKDFQTVLREVVLLRSCCLESEVDAECERLIDLMNG